MDDTQLEELEGSLRHHLKLLRILMNDPDRHEGRNYLPIAGQLRVLLCDSNLPILLFYADEHSVPLPIVATLLRNVPGTVFALNPGGFRPHWNSLGKDKTMPIDSFLDAEIGVVPVGGAGSAYSPRQIIKWVANKEGVSHFDFKKPATLLSLKAISFHSGDTVTEGLPIQDLIYSLGRWTQIAILFVLNMVNQDKLLRQKLAENNEKKPDIKDLERILHYELKAYFEGEHCVVAHDINEAINEGFGFHSLISIPEVQLSQEATCIFELIFKHGAFSLWYHSRSFEVRIRIKDSESFCMSIPGISNIEPYSFSAISLQLDITTPVPRILLAIDGQSMEPMVLDEHKLMDELFITDFVIGSNRDQAEFATFFAWEVFLTKGVLRHHEIDFVSKYLWSSILQEYFKDNV